MVDINIALDPVNDGIVQKTEKITSTIRSKIASRVSLS